MPNERTMKSMSRESKLGKNVDLKKKFLNLRSRNLQQKVKKSLLNLKWRV